MDDTITIDRKEYERLLDRENFLDCLEGCGVDNWQGYDDACAFYRGEEPY